MEGCKINVRLGIRKNQLTIHLKNKISRGSSAVECSDEDFQGNKQNKEVQCTDTLKNYKAVFIHVGTNSAKYSVNEIVINEFRNLIRTA